MNAYRSVLLCVFVATLFVIVLLAVAVLKVTLMTSVILAGALGAFFSSLIRLYRFEDLPRALIGGGLGLRNIYLVVYALVPMVVGAIAAAALYVAFAAGYIKGGLFPEFDCFEGKTCAEFRDFVENFKPKPPDGYAKALIWGFIAGFSERLVPDLLGRIAASAKAEEPSKKN